ncbi:MAG: DUF3881 family protein [Lachnospiraceae bacterium]|nr:DUF3881 family protein [Lachnospiraceae bacterium]
MHQYLRAVGFSNIKSKKDLRILLNEVVTGRDFSANVATDRDTTIVQYTKQFAGPCGITLRGEIEEENNLSLDFYYPSLNGFTISTNEDLTIERHAEKESFAGVLEDVRVGVTLIFYLQNGVEYMKQFAKKAYNSRGNITKFAGLSLDGMILLPIKKDAKELAKVKKATNSRKERIVAAREGNEEAIESLTLEDIDTYSAISKKILKEDVYSLVDTYFMPYGVECDQYSILAEIEDVHKYENYVTDEEVYVMTLNCNELKLDICINKEDLLGEPMIGRRFKGNIWLQGKVEFA